jgi:predicted sulfurtransferase
MRAAILLALTIALTGSVVPSSCRREKSQSKVASGNGSEAPQQSRREDGNTQTEGDPFAAILRIKPDEVARAVKEGRAVLVDIRDEEAYAEEHIRGAVSIPLEEIRERGPKELPAAKLIVTYCA